MAGIPLRLKGPESAGPNTNNPQYSPGTSIYAFQEMTSGEIYDGIIYKMLKEFARINLSSPSTGDLTLLDSVGNVATVVAGDFVDTDRVNAVGTRGSILTLQAVNTNEVPIYQVLSTVSGNIVRPICYRNGSLSEMTDQEIFDSIISPALDAMTNRGIGSYHFSAGAPTDPSGNILPGTWSSVFSVVDRYKTGNISNTSAVGFVRNPVGTSFTGTYSGSFTGSYTRYDIPSPTTSVAHYTTDATSAPASTTYTLWRKVEGDVPVSQPRPLKYVNSAERGKHITEMTNADILQLLVRFRNAIITDGRGRYRFQATSPTAGTWGRRGDPIDDLVNAIGEGSYSSGYAISYTGSYTAVRTSFFTGSYTRLTQKSRSQRFANWKPGDPGRTATFTGFYGAAVFKSFSRDFTETIPRAYARIILTTSTAPVISEVNLPQNREYLWVKRSN